jgi:hypothetical protein
MVHALREAHRVLAPNGVAVDLRPAAVHRRVAIEHRGRRRHLGVMRERFDLERAADQAVTEAVRDGWYRTAPRRRFPCTRFLDTLADFRGWLAEFYTLTGSPSHEWLVQRIERALDEWPAGSRIVVTAPVTVGLLKKQRPHKVRS